MGRSIELVTKTIRIGIYQALLSAARKSLRQSSLQLADELMLNAIMQIVTSRLVLPPLLTANRLYLYIGVAVLMAISNWSSRYGEGWLPFLEGMVLGSWTLIIGFAVVELCSPLLARLPGIVSCTLIGAFFVLHTYLRHFLFADFYVDRFSMVPARIAETLIFVAIYLRASVLYEQLLNRSEVELEAKIQSLQSRIRPHFLFNGMNIIASLIPTEPEKAETVVEDLAELFRASLQETSSFVTIQQEIDLCRRYLNIESLRLGDRLQVEWSIDEKLLSVPVPLLLIQPLVENAVYHGMQMIPEGGRLEIPVQSINGDVGVRLSNPVPRTDQPESADKKKRSAGEPRFPGNQIAIKNIRDRLGVIYGSKAYFKSALSGRTFEVFMQFPPQPTTH